MWRTAIATALVYLGGHPGLDGYRPVALDRPLHAFHIKVNEVVREGRRIVGTVDGARIMGFVRSYAERVDDQLKHADADLR